MRHDWDNWTHTDKDVCKHCGLERRPYATLVGIDGLNITPADKEYNLGDGWENGKKVEKHIKTMCSGYIVYNTQNSFK